MGGPPFPTSPKKVGLLTQYLICSSQRPYKSVTVWLQEVIPPSVDAGSLR